MMNRGPWHQCGDRSQRLVAEELQNGRGVGVVLSPRDLAYPNAASYAATYRELDAAVALDLQFYNPAFSNAKLATYPMEQIRVSVSELGRIGEDDLTRVCESIEAVARAIESSVLIAPAVLYQAESPRILDLNERLLAAARQVGDVLGIPTWATIFLGRSVAESDSLLDDVLAAVTTLDCDGWYFAFEFPTSERLPTSDTTVQRFLEATLALACTGRPVFHAYAGPMALLSLAAGATAAGVAHWQNLWGFHSDRWEPAHDIQGGGGSAPARYFTRTLWGTIIYPDETARVAAETRASIVQPSPFSAQVAQGLPWSRWNACKHLVSALCDEVTTMSALPSTRARLQHARRLLQAAVSTHAAIAAQGIALKDATASYQSSWEEALGRVQSGREHDLKFLDLLRESQE